MWLFAFPGFWFGFRGGSRRRSVGSCALSLSKLPTVGADIELCTLLTGFLILPGILADRAVDEDFLTFLGQLGEVCGGWPPHLDVDECGDLLPFSLFGGVELVNRQRG